MEQIVVIRLSDNMQNKLKKWKWIIILYFPMEIDLEHDLLVVRTSTKKAEIRK